MRSTIAILGCGWLGLPLGARLARQGYRVKGSTTTPEKLELLEEAGIDPYLLRLGSAVEGERAGAFFEADVLVLNIPPGRRDPDVRARFGERMAAVRERLAASPVRYVLFASSTSVYPNLGRVVTEEDATPADIEAAPTDSGKALLEAEGALMADVRYATTVVRLAGLYGYDRRPGRFLAGKAELDGGEAPVNLIHRDDAVAIFAALIEAGADPGSSPGQAVRGETFNAASDVHPTRRRFYTWAAGGLGLDPPTFRDGAPARYKVVSSEKLKRRLSYRFLHPDPMAEAP